MWGIGYDISIITEGSDVKYGVDVTSARLPNRQPKRIRAKFTLRTATTRVSFTVNKES